MATTQRAGIENMKLFRWRMPGRSLAIVASAAIAFGITSTAGVLGRDTLPPREENAAATAKPNFDKVGPQVGDQLPDLKLRTIKGEPQRLGDAWRGGPALVVTSSFTCPKSRSRWPELSAIAEKYGPRLNVVIVYVIEAHPVGSICPYKGVEEVTTENQRDGILRHQPKTLEVRLELAQDFKRYLRADLPIYVDTLNNQAWKAFGAAPNIAFLVDSNGVVSARQGWFDGAGMQKSIDPIFNKPSLTKGPSLTNEQWLAQQRIQEQIEAESVAAKDRALERTGLDRRALINATESRDVAKLKDLVKKVPGGANFVFYTGSLDKPGPTTTWLMEAVDHWNPAAAEVLLDNGADVNARASSVGSALQQAARTGGSELVRVLLRHNADPNLPRSGETPLHECLVGGHRDVARILIEAGAKEDFYSDVGLGHVDAVRKALAADPSWALRPDGENRMPLDYAAANGQIKVAKLLLESGAPTAKDDFSRRRVPLHYAIDLGSAPMVALLLETGSSPNTIFSAGEDARFEPPLHMAIDNKSAEILKLLLSHGADLKHRNNYSQTALHHAAGSGTADLAEILIRAGADVNAPQLRFSLPCSGEGEIPTQNTPLHFAAASGNSATIKVLLAAGAKIDARNVKGITPLISTIEPPLYPPYPPIEGKTRRQNIELLLSSGADINARDERGRTILDIATEVQTGKEWPPGYFTAEERQAMQGLVEQLGKHGAAHGEPKQHE